MNCTTRQSGDNQKEMHSRDSKKLDICIEWVFSLALESCKKLCHVSKMAR